jgi:hypothetical protein
MTRLMLKSLSTNSDSILSFSNPQLNQNIANLEKSLRERGQRVSQLYQDKSWQSFKAYGHIIMKDNLVATIKEVLAPLKIGHINVVAVRTIKEKDGKISIIFRVASDIEAALIVRNRKALRELDPSLVSLTSSPTKSWLEGKHCSPTPPSRVKKRSVMVRVCRGHKMSGSLGTVCLWKGRSSTFLLLHRPSRI